MKQHMPFLLAALGFVLALALCFLIGAVTGIHWLTFDHFQDMWFEGLRLESGYHWVPVLLAVLVAHYGWKYGERFLNDT